MCAAASMDIGFFCFGLMPVRNATENIFSNKWPLTGWPECCPSSCPPAAECKASGTEESSEKMTAPAWSGRGLKGQGKLYDSQKDDMMVRRTGTSLRRTGSNANQFLPVPFAKQQDVEESAKGPPMKDKRSEDYPEPLWFVSLVWAFMDALSMLLTHYGTYPLLLAEMAQAAKTFFFFLFLHISRYGKNIQLQVFLFSIFSDSPLMGNLNG